MLQWIEQTHPLVQFIVGWGAFLLLMMSPFLIRAWRRHRGEAPEQSGITSDPLDPRPVEDPVLLLTHRVARIPMHNRFMPDSARSHVRDLALVDQIMADQRVADEKPGEMVDAPAPGEPEYEPPHATIRLVVGAFTFVLERGCEPLLIEAAPDGSDYPPVPVAEPWNDVVTALVFEVHRLREGWTSPDRYMR